MTTLRVKRSAFAVAIALTLIAAGSPDRAAIDECLARVREIHGSAGPWAVAGYRIGERSLREFGIKRHDFSISIVHRCPAKVRYSCMADGLQAATGASAGKLNLKVEEAPVEALQTVVVDKKSGRTLAFTLRPKLVESIRDISYERLEAEGERVARLADDEIFSIVDKPGKESGK